MSTRIHTLSRAGVVLALLLAVLALPLVAFAANTVVTPASPNGWGPTDVRADATVGITADQPRDGLGSLKFTTNTVTNGQDKADFTKTWTSTTRTLASLSDVSYEFYRDSSSTTAAHFAPVLRLLWWQDNAPAGPGSEDHTGYLIWSRSTTASTRCRRTPGSRRTCSARASSGCGWLAAPTRPAVAAKPSRTST